MTIGLSPCCSAPSLTSLSIVSGIEHLLQRGEVDLPAGEHGYVRTRNGSKAFRDLAGRQLGFEPITDRGLVELGTVLQCDDRGDELSALGIGEPDDVRDGPAGDLGDG